jgi:hypothetical protein
MVAGQDRRHRPRQTDLPKTASNRACQLRQRMVTIYNLIKSRLEWIFLPALPTSFGCISIPLPLRSGIESRQSICKETNTKPGKTGKNEYFKPLKIDSCSITCEFFTADYLFATIDPIRRRVDAVLD